MGQLEFGHDSETVDGARQASTGVERPSGVIYDVIVVAREMRFSSNSHYVMSTRLYLRVVDKCVYGY